MSTMANRIKRFYDKQLWTKQQVHEAVAANAITVEEYKLITGEEYVVV